MPRHALAAEHIEDIKIDQPKALGEDLSERTGEIVRAEKIDKAWVENLAFAEEPVTIRLEPSAEKNAARTAYVCVNGKNCEVLINGQWQEAPQGHIPVGMELTIKRKYLAVLVGSKINTITTEHDAPGAEFINNRTPRSTSAVFALSVIEDRNPKGIPWLTELRRRHF